MTATAQPLWLSPRSLAAAAAVSAALLWSSMSGDLLRPLLSGEAIRSVPYLRSALISLADALVMAAFVSLAAGRGPAAVLALTGLNTPILRPVAWGALVLAPAALVCLAFTPMAEGVSSADIAWLAIGGPVIEEIVYRGLAIGALMRLSGWRFLPAALLPALFFGAAHAWAGKDPMDVAGVVAITGAGGLLFGWLYARWRFNLWPAIILHVGLNALWLIFALGENAVGGWFGNAVRLAVVIFAIAGTLMLAPRKP